MFDIRRLGTAAMFLILLAAGPARAAPEVGWWWNPNESGRGFFVESQNGIIYLAGYFYEPDGRATWLVSGGPNADPYNYQGRLLAYSNGQTLFGDYKPPTTPLDAGPVSISFSDDTHGTIVWPGGMIPIERQRFGAGTAAFGADSGWWWNEAESGRGYSIEVQGDKIFVVSFMYDAAGRPVWYYSAGTMTSPTTYSGPWLQFSGGQTLLGPYQPPGTPVEVGQLSLQFTATDQATLTFQDARAATPTPGDVRKQSKVINVKREFKPKDRPLPAGWKGGIKYFYKSYSETANQGTQIVTQTWSAPDIVLEADDMTFPLTPPFPENSKADVLVYFLKSGVLTVEPTYFQVSADNKSLCESVPGQKFQYPLKDLDVRLTANTRGQYLLRLTRDASIVILNVTCKNPNGTVSTTFPVPVNLYVAEVPYTFASGVVTRDLPATEQVVPNTGPNTVKKVTTSMSWYFEAIK